MIKAYLRGEQEDLDLHLDSLAAAYPATPHESTGLTPNLLMLGREVRLPVELAFGYARNQTGGNFISYGEYVLIRERMHHAHQVANIYSLQRDTKRIMNYKDDPFLSEFPTQEVEMPYNVQVTQSHINEPTPTGGVMPSPVRQPMTKSDHVKSPKKMSSSVSSTCTCCKEHKQNRQRLVEKFTVAVDAMNCSISLAAQAVREALGVSLDALSNVTKAVQAVAFQQYQKITNNLIKSINVRNLTYSTETIGNQPVLKEDKGRNEERTDNKENKKSDRRREQQGKEIS
ncbi:hypothetical protein CHS0354_035749 [Potamilus streckersoni]|uniref:Uncharacterized protein n=1 Tax=Potamilus streckersoni TaxID=2493646 RepID=A0AAE0VM90_9BIVA|nr:hypothetical protein CHS0354_035749 [Potamilus streckersoni]